MAAHSLFSAAIVGAIASVSAAGLAVGTYIRDAAQHDVAAALPPSVAGIETGTLPGAHGGMVVAQATSETSGDGAAPTIAPTFSRIVIEQTGISRLEGFGPPGGDVAIQSAGRQIAVARAGKDGAWSVSLERALPPGEHRLGSSVATPSRLVIGEDVRVFVPADFEGPKVIAYEAPNVDDLRRRAEALAVNAAQGFDEVMVEPVPRSLPGKDVPRGKDNVAVGNKGLETAGTAVVREPAAAPTSAGKPKAEEPQGSLAPPVIDWLDRSHQTFNNMVAKPLSAPATPAPATLAPASSAKASEDGAAPAVETGPSLLDRARGWFSDTGTAFESGVVKPLSADGASSDDDKRRAEDAARRYAEEQKRATAALREAEAKRAAEAKSADALKKAEEARRRQAEETERMQADVKRAAEAAARRTAETEKRLEESFKRLDEAEKAQRAAADAKRAEAAQRELEAARKDYEQRRAAAEAATKTRTAAATVGPAPRNEAPAAPPAPTVVEPTRRSTMTAADAAEDQKREDEEYSILRRMIAEAKRLTQSSGEAPRDEAPSAASEDTVVASADEARDDEASDDRERSSVGDAGRVARASKGRAKSAGRVCSGRRKGRRPGYHFVASHETLWGIARRFYGRGERFDIIYRANRDRLSSPDVLRPCQWLRIPGRRRYH